MRQISDKNQEIENLQRSLEEKKQKANLLAKQHQSILETSDLTVQKIQQNVDEVSTELKKLIRENRQSEKALQEVQLCLTLYTHCVILYKPQHIYFSANPTDSERVLYPSQKNSKLERDTEVLLQDFDDEIEEIQVKTPTEFQKK